MTRRLMVAGNWKMNLLRHDVHLLLKSLVSVNPLTKTDLLVAPPFVHLKDASDFLNGTSILLSAQDVSPYDQGAYTGDISVDMLLDMGCQYVIVGHSERRSIHHEDNAYLNLVIKQCLSSGLKVIYCVGETQSQRDLDETNAVIEKQLLEGLLDVDINSDQIVIAYEPIWAIGTGLVATPEQAQLVHSYIRHIILSMTNASLSNSVRILYGGSVKPNNIFNLIQQSDIDGALVGGASLNASDFLSILKTVDAST